jgi:hypothetical protein
VVGGYADVLLYGSLVTGQVDVDVDGSADSLVFEQGHSNSVYYNINALNNHLLAK